MSSPDVVSPRVVRYVVWGDQWSPLQIGGQMGGDAWSGHASWPGRFSDEEPYLVEVNPRLVSAQILFQMGYALERSIYLDLINLHLGFPLTGLHGIKQRLFGVIRWITADRPGILASIEVLENADASICRDVVFKTSGDPVRPPINNGDRIGYVIAVGETQSAAEKSLDRYVRETKVILQ